MDAVKRVEIITNKLELKKVLEILEKVKVSGYTVIDNASGYGDRGISNGQVDLAFSNTCIITVCNNNEQLTNLVDRVKPMLAKVGGVCLVTDAYWVNH